MDTPISRAEFNQYKETCEAEHKSLEREDRRQNERLEIVERQVGELFKIASNIERLAVNMENMAKEQEEQGQRLASIENRDGEKWRKTLEYIGFAILGAVLAVVFAKFGM